MRRNLLNIIGFVGLTTFSGACAGMVKYYAPISVRGVEPTRIALQDTSYEALQQRRVDALEEAHQSFEAYLAEHSVSDLADDACAIGRLGTEKIY
ncbi:MAG: hypothetical protein KKG75_03815 [Nanoarchaeota archaeon]|nr:hypothetical protein [Nanoarchaeota archaeon]